MKLSIRLKFFVILLCFSLGPLLLSRTIMGNTADKVTESIADKTKSELHEIVSREMESNAISLLNLLDRGGRGMELGARMLAREAAHALAGEALPSDAKAYYTIDFNDPDIRPPDAAPVGRYVRRTMSGKVRSLLVSFDHPAFHLPRGLAAPAVQADIRRLLALVPVLKGIGKAMVQAPYWFDVSLESGVSMTYPGHGRFPMMYDPRGQEWYRESVTPDVCNWKSPTVDPATRNVMSLVACPVFDRDGRRLGVASISVPISAIMSEPDLKTDWHGEVGSFMVLRQERAEGGKGLRVIARQTHGEEGRHHWMSGLDEEWLSSADADGFDALLDVMDKQTSGVVRLPFEGEDSVWAFASNPEFSFLLIAPESVVNRVPDMVSRGIGTLFNELRDISAFISGIMLVITGLIAWFGSRKVTKPLLVMADAAKRLAGGDFSVHMNMQTGDERDQLIGSFNNMVPKLQERVQLRRDLELAQEVQNLLLPRSTPSLPGFDIAGGIAYCDQTGGDYYDFIEMDNAGGRALGVVVGDVSGHGVPSALLMATARGQIHSLSHLPLSPRRRISAINTHLARDMDGTGRFLTMFYLRLVADDPAVRWVRAGHDPAIRYSPSTDVFSELGGDGIALGVLGGFEFEDYGATLESGEVLVISTDGVWEARDKSGEMFGKQRMLAIIRQNAHKKADDIRFALMAAVDAYQGNGQEDDIAVVVIKKD